MVADLEGKIVHNLTTAMGKEPVTADGHDWLKAAILVVRDRAAERWVQSLRETRHAKGKRVYYLSLEFLIGRLLRDALANLGLLDEMRQALANLGVDIDIVAELEPDAALGNGGLGRLAACFMESMASLGIPAYGYGIRYRHGLFRQKIVNGEQVEEPEDWLAHGNPWEFERRERQYEVGFGGSVDAKRTWSPAEKVRALAYDTPVCGWRGRRVNTLRLWASRAVEPFSLDTVQQRRSMSGPRAKRRAQTASRGCSIRPTTIRPAGSCVCASSIFLPPRRCRICSPVIGASSAMSEALPIRRRSTSTTRIRPSRFPS